MRVIGAGLSKTGTTSLKLALVQLGMKVLHNDMQRLAEVVSGADDRPNFRRYDDYDAVLDLPTSFFFAELLDTYPESKCILTVRDEDSWWQSVRSHFNEIFPIASRAADPVRWDIRHLAYGSAKATEFLFRKAYREHNELVKAVVPANRLLVVDIVKGEGWEKVCPFLSLNVPSASFPHGNERSALARFVRDGGTRS
ncbi:MAG: sulfotransferase family protein [Kiloniellaceae bacterium]